MHALLIYFSKLKNDMTKLSSERLREPRCMYANPALDVRQLCPALALGAFSPRSSRHTRPGSRKSSDARLVPSMTPLYVALAECTSPPLLLRLLRMLLLLLLPLRLLLLADGAADGDEGSFEGEGEREGG